MSELLKRRSSLVPAVALAVALIGCAQATGPGGPSPGAAFIAFLKDSNIWIVAADGSVSRQVTNDGATSSYRDPAVAPDGTIYALRGEDTLYHFDVTGRQLANPAPLAVLENGAEGLAVAPDGAHLAFVTTGWGTLVDARWGTYAGQYIYGGTDVITPDGRSVPGAAMGQMLYPSWSGSSTLVVSDGTVVYSDSFPQSQPSAWLAVTNGCVIPELCENGQEAQANFARAVINKRATIVAYEYQPFFGTAGRRMAKLDGPPPSTPAVRCLAQGQENYGDPGSFSADGSKFAFDDTVFDPDALETRAGQGIWVMTVDLDAADCGLSTAKLIAPGGFQPDWGPTGS